ncbi:MAG TPA: class I SAM-dependent methyltransferase [Kiritimatiellia bacterium]|nr:class I SAM-dependent methyltransferase [Kiritimatiellia bacterium]
MKRTVEPELMEEAGQAAAYALADFAAPHSRLVDLFRERFPDAPTNARVLDLGCGPGDVALRFAAAYPGWRIDGVDGSEAMLAAADICHHRHPGLRDRVRLLHGMLPDCALPEARYDIVISNSLLHHLHDPNVLWRSVRKWAAPGAPVFIADLRRPATAEEARRLTEFHTAGEAAELRRDFHHSLHAAFEPDEIRQQLRDTGLAHFSIDLPSDRHVLVWGHAP